jgi:hypothetical protein
MIDPSIQHLIEQAIDTPIKLQLLLLYYENPRFEGTDFQVAERIYRDIWSTREALAEMTEDGLLFAANVDKPVYRYQPRPEYREPIFRLAQSYNEPLERDQLQREVREIASYAPYRRTTSQSAVSFDRLPI